VRKMLALICVAAIAFLAATGAANAQARPAAEVWGHVGSVFGIPDLTSGITDSLTAYSVTASVGESGFKWSAGGGVGVPLSDHIAVVGEIDMNRLGGWDIDLKSGRTTASMSVALKMLNLAGGLRYSFTTSGPVTPFVGGGIGIARQSATVTGSSIGAAVSASNSAGLYYVGGGVTVRAGARWAVRPELRLCHIPDGNYYRATVSFVYRLGR
jgi:opacity protein-like surface antigen